MNLRLDWISGGFARRMTKIRTGRNSSALAGAPFGGGKLIWQVNIGKTTGTTFPEGVENILGTSHKAIPKGEIGCEK